MNYVFIRWLFMIKTYSLIFFRKFAINNGRKKSNFIFYIYFLITENKSHCILIFRREVHKPILYIFFAHL